MSWLDDAEKRHAEIPGAGNYADLGIALTILRRAMKTTADTIVLLEHGTSPSEVDEWRDTARSEMAGRRAAEAQVQRLLTTMEHQGVILKAQRARTEHAEAALRELVRGIDDWDAAVGQIIKRPINHKWAGLERARALLGDTASTCRCGHSMEAHRCAEPGCKRGCHANDGSDGPCDCALRDPAPLPTSQPARAIEVCKRAATAPAAQPLDARAHAGDGESAQRELATAPAEGFFARGDDGHYHPDPAPAELRCVRCGSPYVAAGACSRRAEGCQGGRGEWTVYAAPACPHGHPAGSARDCACHEPEKPSGRAFRAHCLCPAGLHMPACACECHAEGKP